MRRAACIFAAAAVAGGAPPAGAATLAPPADGPIVRAFLISPSPYAAGQHRGIDLAARAGATVRAPCAGRVAFAGPMPGHGPVTTIVCGVLRVSVLGLAKLGVRAGDALGRGSPLGTAGAGAIHLGVRRGGRYIDPAPLLERSRAPVAPPPLVPARRLRPRLPSGGAGPPAAAPAPAWIAAAGFGAAGAALLPALRLRRRRAAHARRRAAQGAAGRPLRFAADGLLHHDPDLLRERPAASGPRVHIDRRGRDGPAHAPARGGRLLPHGNR